MRFKTLNTKVIFLLLVMLFIIKILIFFLVKNKLLVITTGGGNDADFYDAYALGYTSVVTSVWNIILRNMNEYGLYSRQSVSYILLFFNVFLIPLLCAKLASLSFKREQKLFLYACLVVSIYPILYFYTFDIYRDVFMALSFLISCFFVKFHFETRNFFLKGIFLFLSTVLGYFLFLLRGYLGVAFLVSILLCQLSFPRLGKRSLLLILAFYFVFLFLMSYAGILESLVQYRNHFSELDAGSNLGLDFSNPIMFLPNLILSILGQLFGLYIINPLSLVLFVIETIPFVFMLKFIFKNICLLNRFNQFLLVFFVIYGSIWLIANDNLGSAVRLRIFNYLSIYIVFFHVVKCYIIKKSEVFRVS